MSDIQIALVLLLVWFAPLFITLWACAAALIIAIIKGFFHD